MNVRKLQFNATQYNFEYFLNINGKRYELKFYYNEREDRYYLDIKNVQTLRSAKSIKLIPNADILSNVAARLGINSMQVALGLLPKTKDTVGSLVDFVEDNLHLTLVERENE